MDRGEAEEESALGGSGSVGVSHEGVQLGLGIAAGTDITQSTIYIASFL